MHAQYMLSVPATQATGEKGKSTACQPAIHLGVGLGLAIALQHPRKAALSVKVEPPPQAASASFAT